MSNSVQRVKQVHPIAHLLALTLVLRTNANYWLIKTDTERRTFVVLVSRSLASLSPGTGFGQKEI